MNFYKASIASLFLSTCGSIIVYGSELNEKNSAPLTTKDTLGQIAQFLGPEQDIKNLRLVSKEIHQNTNDYLDQLPSNLIRTTFKINEDVSLFNLLHYQNKNFSLLKKMMGTEKLAQALAKHIKDQTENNHVFFLLQDSPLGSYLDEVLKTYTVFDGYELYKKHKKTIDTDLFGTESDETYKAMVAQHLLSPFTFYVPIKEQDNQLQSFWEQNQSNVMGFLKTAYQKNNYIKFSDKMGELSTNSHICITDTQMADENNKEKLENILKNNSNHRLILNVGSQFVTGDAVNLNKGQVPANLAHLIICNIQNNVTTIGDWFLSNATSLKSFDTRGFNNVTTIGDWFLSNATSLESFDTRGFNNVTTIGNWFLYGATSLESFDTNGLKNVTTIGDSFLSNATSLESFDTRGFNNVTTIGNWFLYGATSLESFDTNGLKNITTIGNYFLSNATSLESFNTSGLKNLTTIGDSFLDNVPAKKSQGVQEFLKRLS